MAKIFINEVHAQNVLQRMWEQSERKEFCDVALIPGDNEGMQISAHRSVLCATSEYFKLMFTPPFNESKAKVVKLPNVDGESLKELVKFCYSGRLELSEDNAEKLLITADSLLLEPVVNACGDFLAEQLHPTNCLGMAQLAERYHCQSLIKKTKDYCMQNFVELYKSDEFLNLSVEQLTQLLASDDLCDPTEEHVFKSLMIWLEHDRSNREQHKDAMLRLVRLPLMNTTFLIEHVKPACNSIASLKLYNAVAERQRQQVNASKFTKPRRSGERLMAVKVQDDKLDILYHCPQQRKWLKWLENLEYRTDFGVAVLGEDLFIVGSLDKYGNASNTVSCLNLKTMILKNVNPMCERRCCLGVAVINSVLYAVGGYNENNDLSTVEKWDAKSNTWNMVASMSVGRYDFGITVFNGKIYAVGGYDTNSAECYNPQENVWTSIASMCESRVCPGLAVVNGVLYAVGGHLSRTMECYDHETNKWTLICSFSEEIYCSLCTTFNDKLIALYNNRLKEYNSTTNKWEVNTTVTGLENAYRTFSFTGSVLESQFIENQLNLEKSINL